MTLSIFDFNPPRATPRIDAPAPVACEDVSVVVPVRDNQAGIERILSAFASLTDVNKPACVIIVDNLSRPRLTKTTQGVLSVKLLRCDTPGPAAARNVGWKAAATPWVLFMDADCVPTPDLLPSFIRAANGAVAYAGNVRSLHGGRVTEFYDAQRTLVPPPTQHERPAYLVTANAMVYRPAMAAVGGFREAFNIAGGEDIDLALRLRTIGELSYAMEALVLHDFEDDLRAFWRRFVRYGRGNRYLEELHDVRMRPLPFVPARRTLSHAGLAWLQFLAMTAGYALAHRDLLRRGRTAQVGRTK